MFSHPAVVLNSSFCRLSESGKLPVGLNLCIVLSNLQSIMQIRLYLMGNVPSNDYWGPQIPRLSNYGKDGRLNVRSVKLYTDG